MNPTTATTDVQCYLFNDETQTVLRGPRGRRATRPLLASRAPARRHTRGQGQPGHDRGPRRAARQRPRARRRTAGTSLNDDPSLQAAPTSRTRSRTSTSGTGGSGRRRHLRVHRLGRASKWQNVTRTIAQRGAGNRSCPASRRCRRLQHFAIVLDDELISVPYIDFHQNPDGIDGAPARRSPAASRSRRAQDLANLLKTGALPVKLELISQSQVSATLGKQALDQGLIAGIVGFAVVALFLLVFYRVLGLIAVARRWPIYAHLLLRADQADPDHADAAGDRGPDPDDRRRRRREHRDLRARQGGDTRAAARSRRGIATGYKKGLSAIIDANVVTLMTAFILFILATAGVKGFAFTLGVGTHRLAVHRRAGDAGDPRHDGALAADLRSRARARRRRAARPLALRLHGRVAVVLLDVRRDPARSARWPSAARA